MAKITVTITTEEEKKPSKIDALLEAAVKTKAYADNVKAVKQPIIELAGEAKFDEIVRQLDEALERVKKVFSVTGNWEQCWDFGWIILKSYNEHNIYFVVSGGTKLHEVKKNGVLPRYILGLYGLVPEWDEDRIIEKIDLELERELNKFIIKQKEKAEEVSKTLDKIIG